MDPFVAQIMMFGGNFPPRGWTYCNGQLMDIASHTAVFSLVGTYYGGDGRTTFGIPDFRGRLPMHHGHGPGLTPRSIGQKSGQEDVTLVISQIPSHNHTAALSNASGTLEAGSGKAGAYSPGAFLATSNGFTGGSGGGAISGIGNISGNVALGHTGGGQSHNNMQPYQVVSFCFALEGIYPSRN